MVLTSRRDGCNEPARARLISIGAINLPSASRRLTDWLSLFKPAGGLRIGHISADECQIPHHPFSFYQKEVSAVAIKELADRLRKSIASSEALLVKATKDRSFDTEHRIELARIGGVLRYLSRDLEEFLAIGETTLAAVASGKQQEARQASLGFAKFAQAFGPDLSQLRHDLDNLTSRSTSAVLGRPRLNAYLTFALFFAACGLGLGISAIGSTRVVANSWPVLGRSKPGPMFNRFGSAPETKLANWRRHSIA